MSQCSHCLTNVSFMAVLNTINPFKLKCSKCKTAIRIDKVSGSIAVVAILAIMLPAMYFFKGTESYFLKVLLPVALAAEFAYFALIKYGVVKIKAA